MPCSSSAWDVPLIAILRQTPPQLLVEVPPAQRKQRASPKSQSQCLTVREAVYEGAFSTPKTTAGLRQIPLSDSTVKLIVDWKARVTRNEPESLVFSTWSGKPISPNNVSRRWVYPVCETLGLKRVNWLTLRRTYSSWAHEKGVPDKVIAQLMGHAKWTRRSTCTRRSSMAHFAEPPKQSDPNCSQLFTNRKRARR